MSSRKRAALLFLGLGMIGIGVDHFANPDPFVRIMPASLPYPRELVALSGLFEVLGGIGVLVPRTRRFAAWGLIALYVAVFPANVNMAIHHIQLTPDGTFPVWAMWLRLLFQPGFIAWAWLFTRPDEHALAAETGPERR